MIKPVPFQLRRQGGGFAGSICGISAWGVDVVYGFPHFPFSLKEPMLMIYILLKDRLTWKRKFLTWFLLTHLLLLYVILDLIQDWSSDSAPDIYSFVPYMWNFKVMFHQFEMIWAANQHNWIDCSTKQQENGKVSLRFETVHTVTKFLAYLLWNEFSDNYSFCYCCYA